MPFKNDEMVHCLRNTYKAWAQRKKEKVFSLFRTEFLLHFKPEHFYLQSKSYSHSVITAFIIKAVLKLLEIVHTDSTEGMYFFLLWNGQRTTADCEILSVSDR